jgi:hypothetical protein
MESKRDAVADIRLMKEKEWLHLFVGRGFRIATPDQIKEWR